jgi:hypothetical protein
MKSQYIVIQYSKYKRALTFEPLLQLPKRNPQLQAEILKSRCASNFNIDFVPAYPRVLIFEDI